MQNYEAKIQTILLSFTSSEIFLNFYGKFEPLLNLLIITIITFSIKFFKCKIQALYGKKCSEKE